MTSRNGLIGLLAAAALTVTGCAVRRPTGFTGRSDSFCSDAMKVIAGLSAPTEPAKQLQYALDRYTAVEKAVSELTDSSLPGGSAGDQLRARWLRPARASLTDGRAALVRLRTAVNAVSPADRDRTTSASSSAAAFELTQAIGTQGVDVGLLRAHGLTQCAALFTPGSA